MSSFNSYLYLSKSKDDIDNIKSNDLFFIQHFETNCNRARNEVGNPYGDTKSALLSVTIKDVVCIDEFYKQMKEQEAFNYYIVTNATFNNGQLNSNQCNILKVRGYVVDITEDYVYSPNKVERSELASATIQILIASMSYKYYNGHEKTLVITH